jgi:hypothetical protein
LWHQGQRKGQPFRKTVVRMPGPSSVENFWMLKTIPLSDDPLMQGSRVQGVK